MYVIDENGLYLGYISVRFSSDCQTVWTEMYSNWGGSSLFAEINSDGLSYSSTTGVSPMIYDPSPSGGWGHGSITATFSSIFYCVDEPYWHCPPVEHYGAVTIWL